ncbi:MAG TPA: cyclic nucleotide-binding domain-containing protein, partial [Rhodospirillales bacterium]|nr:cyclic nucleotide-binding domain-containing protein [Rhodospirillales bacterium]
MNEAVGEGLGLHANDLAALRSSPLFHGLDSDALGQVLAGAAVLKLPQGRALFVQDEPVERFFLLLDGWMKLYRLGADGTETIVGVIAPGETFAEAAS